MDIVAEALNGLAAAQIIQSAQPDLVFLDIQMPDMTGLEVAAQLQSETAPLIVFVTAHDDHAVEAFDLGAVDYLLKPYDRSRFPARAHAHSPAIERRRPARDLR